MSGNGNVICPKCQSELKVLKSGVGQYHLQCGCGLVNKGFCTAEAANLSGLDEETIKKIAINLMVTDVCI